MRRGLRKWFGRGDIFAGVGLFLLNMVWCIALWVPFNPLDDAQYIVDNRYVWNGLSWETVGWAFTTTLGGFWIPLTWLSLALDTTIFGQQAWGYHATNVAFHAVNALLAYAFFREALGGIGKSFFAAALFSLHPQRVESVAWATERKDVLAVFFGLLALLAYVRFVRAAGDGRGRRYCVVLVLFVCNLMAKPMLVTFPVLLLVLDFWPLGRVAGVWRLVREKIPLLLFALAISVDTYLIQFAAGALGSSLGVRLRNMVVGYFLSIRDFFYVGDLAVVYAPREGIPAWEVAGAGAVLVGITAGIGVLLWRRHCAAPALAVGWVWFVGVLFPMSGILQSGINIRADRFTYFPAIGMVIALVWGVWPLCGGERLPRWAAAAAGSAVIVVAGGLMVNRLLVWRDPLGLFEHDLAVERSGFLEEVAGMAAEKRGLRERALEHFRRAGELEPGLRFLYPLEKSKFEAEGAAR